MRPRLILFISVDKDLERSASLALDDAQRMANQLILARLGILFGCG
jgi:hypothetical protein